MTHFIAGSIYFGAMAIAAILVYQAAILPGIRLSLRYRAFALRDRLRSLVIDGGVRESDPAFDLLHGKLNYMCASISRYDMARLVQSIRSMDNDRRVQVEAAQRLMEGAPPEVKKIYEESLEICVRAFVFNSLFVFALATVYVLAYLLVRVGAHQLRDALAKKMSEDTSVGFLVPELAAV